MGWRKYTAPQTPSMLVLSSAQGLSPRPRIPTSFLFARHRTSAKSFLRLPPKKPTHRCKESLSSIRSWRNNQQETDAPSILPERAGVATMPSARIGRKTDKVFKFLFTVNIFGNKRSVRLSKFYCHHDQSIIKLVAFRHPYANLGRNQTKHQTMPPISKSAVATLYIHATRAHCIGKLTNYFSCPNIKVVLRGLYEMEPKVRA